MNNLLMFWQIDDMNNNLANKVPHISIKDFYSLKDMIVHQNLKLENYL